MNRTIKRGLAAIAASSAVAAGAIVATGTAANAIPGTPGCVTRAEFRRVHDGMTRSTVTAKFGTGGHITHESWGSGGHNVTVEYRTCAGDPAWSYAEVDFTNNHEWFKWIYISS